MMVARDPLNKTASFVNPLKLVTNDEKEVFQRGIENKKRSVPPFFFIFLVRNTFSLIQYSNSHFKLVFQKDLHERRLTFQGKS